ncbi:DUF3108 domain-containing protein [Cupriavidus agavae]|uniref:Uncharacterized protein DUF3108 n=1 Tax=Cupriavidus agavae TaxID=1001822 RepID=A0A4Q7RZP7_9BURK|nr:uncharacterized protein DUF3108 [Cupriavidus agavae]
MATAKRPDRTANPRKPGSRTRGASRLRRWLAVLVVVAVAHVVLLFGLLRMPVPSLPDLKQIPALEAILLPPPAPPAPPARPRVPPQARPAPPSPTPAPQPEPDAPALATSPGGDTTAHAGAGGAGSTAEGAKGAPAAPAEAPAAPAPRYAAPPSVTLRYASFVNGVQNPDGIIRWEQDGRQYRLAVETRVLWFRFVFESQGNMTERGLQPTRYEEARRNKRAVARFDHAANMVVFETRGGQAPMPANFQDRFSVFLQLVGWARGDPQRYVTPGATESFSVADTTEVEPMQVQYVGEENIDIGTGMVRTRHFVRLPRHPGDQRRVEIWLAPSLDWMPARLRQTEPDGTQIDLVYRSSEGR